MPKGKRYGGFEQAQQDLGRVLDEIQDIRGVMGVQLDDTEHTKGAGGEIGWTEVEITFSVKRDDAE